MRDFKRRCKVGLQEASDHHVSGIAERDEDPGQDASDKQPSDGNLIERRQKDRQGAGRDEHGQAAAAHHGADAHGLVISPAFHIRNKEGPQDGGRSQGGTAHRREHGASNDGQKGEPSGNPSDPVIENIDGFESEMGVKHDFSHEDEERDRK
jgi:hypothetical protein